MSGPAGLRGPLHWLARALALSGPVQRLSARGRIRIVVFVFPVLTLCAALLYGLESAIFVLRSEPVTATVVERYEWPGKTFIDRGSINYEPIFSYEMQGETRRASVGSGHSSFDIAVGETATIRAIPSSRGNVRLDTWQGLWFMPVILGLLGLAALGVAFPVWWLVDRLLFRKGQE